MNNAVNVVAHGLVNIGVDEKSKVAIMCENRPEWIVSYLSIVTTGSVAVPIDALLGEVETEHILKHSETGTVICSMRTYDVISRVMSEIDTLNNIWRFLRSPLVRVIDSWIYNFLLSYSLFFRTPIKEPLTYTCHFSLCDTIAILPLVCTIIPPNNIKLIIKI